MYIFGKILILMETSHNYKLVVSFREIYKTSTNVLFQGFIPFTGGQNSIFNWVLKLNPLNRKVKSNKNCLDCLESLIYFFTSRSHQQCKHFMANGGQEKRLDKVLYPSSPIELFKSLCQIQEGPPIVFVKFYLQMIYIGRLIINDNSLVKIKLCKSQEYRLVVQLRKLYKANTIISSIFIDWDI